MKKTLLILLLLLAARAVSGDDLKLAAFADSLFDTGDYYRAISEYKRYLFYNPEGRSAQKAAYRIGLSYLYAEKYEDAASVFEDNISSRKGKTAEYSLLAEAYAYFGKKDFNYSSALAARLIADFGASQLKYKAQYITGLDYIGMGEYTEAGNVFASLAGDPELALSSGKIAEYLKKSLEIQDRSPYISAVMSAVIPGTGYMYSGRWAEGFISMAVNAFFIYNTYAAFKGDNNSNKYIYGVPAVVFYLSNIYGSTTAAMRFKEGENRKFIDGALALKVQLLEADFK